MMENKEVRDELVVGLAYVGMTVSIILACTMVFLNIIVGYAITVKGINLASVLVLIFFFISMLGYTACVGYFAKKIQKIESNKVAA